MAKDEQPKRPAEEHTKERDPGRRNDMSDLGREAEKASPTPPKGGEKGQQAGPQYAWQGNPKGR